MTTQSTAHPIAAAVARVEAELAAVREAPAWSMSAAEAGGVLVDLARVEAQFAELQLRVAAHAERVEVGAEVGATSAATWWAHETRQTRSVTHRLMALATALDSGAHEPVREALAAGEMCVEQATVVVRAIDELPADLVDDELRERAEKELVREAAHHDAKALGRLARHLLEVVAPEVGEAHEARLLAAEEERARALTRLTMSDDGHGTTHGRFTLPTLHAEMLRKALLALAAPKHRAATEGAGAAAVRRPGPVRMGRALCELLERLPVDRLPDAGGVSATVVVTMPLATVQGGLAAAQLDTGHRLSAGEARRLLCGAGIMPLVLGGRSEVLDLGRKRRLHTPAQRVALGVRDGGCTAEGCDAPPALCQAHHDPSWASGGPTDVQHARLLCPRHHAWVHDPEYEVTRLPNRRVAFHRRT